MYADAVAKISESMFPIFSIRSDGEGSEVGVRGTGFFLDDSGHFLTADHVIAGAPAGSTLYYYGKVPDEVCNPAVEIEHVASDPLHDLYLGRVCRDSLPPVEFSDEPVRPGSSVCLGGYPMSVLSITSQGGVVGSVRRYWQPTFAIDTTQVVVGKRIYDGYIVQHACLVGMSGGPVFDLGGKVRGISAATISRMVPDPNGSLTALANGVVVDLEHIQGFLEAAGARLAMDERGRAAFTRG
jgi:S1-C subfamily serine protease